MKHLIMIHSTMRDWAHPGFLQLPEFQRLPLEQRQQASGELERLIREITESGELLYAAPLAAPEETRSVRVTDGAVEVQSGQARTGEEVFSGYFVVECESSERALALAARFPDARYAAVQVRPIME